MRQQLVYSWHIKAHTNHKRWLHTLGLYCVTPSRKLTVEWLHGSSCCCLRHLSRSLHQACKIRISGPDLSSIPTNDTVYSILALLDFLVCLADRRGIMLGGCVMTHGRHVIFVWDCRSYHWYTPAADWAVL